VVEEEVEEEAEKAAPAAVVADVNEEEKEKEGEDEEEGNEEEGNEEEEEEEEEGAEEGHEENAAAAAELEHADEGMVAARALPGRRRPAPRTSLAWAKRVILPGRCANASRASSARAADRLMGLVDRNAAAIAGRGSESDLRSTVKYECVLTARKI
jgi:hypothetical protein